MQVEGKYNDKINGNSNTTTESPTPHCHSFEEPPPEFQLSVGSSGFC